MADSSNEHFAHTAESNDSAANPASVAPPVTSNAAVFQQNAEGQSKKSATNGANETNGKPHNGGININLEEDFPALGGSPGGGTKLVTTWGASSSSLAPVKQSAVSNWAPAIGKSVDNAQQLVYELVKENKRLASELKKSQGEIIKEIQKSTGTRIDVATYKETGATVYIIRGPESARLKAKREINKELATRCTRKIIVPAAIRPFIIGKHGAKIQELQSKTSTSIKVPQFQPGEIDEDDDLQIEITIDGDFDGVSEALALIQKIVNERVIKVTRRVNCPGEYCPFIQGPFSRRVEEFETRVDKVIVPDYLSTNTEPPNFSPAPGPIQVIGEKKAVEGVVAEIEGLIQDIRAQNYTVTPAGVPPFSVQLFTRNKGHLIHQIREQTGCTVIAPPRGSSVNKVYIYGPAEMRGQALQLVDKKVAEQKVVTLDLCKPFASAPAGAKVHARTIVRHLSRKGEFRDIEKETGVELVLPSQEELDDLNKSCLLSIIVKAGEGPDDARDRIISVVKPYAPERTAYVNVEPLHQKHIYGKDGKGAKRITAQTSVELLLPKDPEEEQVAFIYEGSGATVEEISVALGEAKNLVLEAVSGQPEIVSKIIAVPREEHDKIKGERGTTLNALNPSSVFVQFGIPKARPGKPQPTDEQTEDSITLRGPSSNVDATKKNIYSLLEETKDRGSPEVITEAFEYPKQFSGNLIGQKGANINRLKEDFGVDVRLNEGKGELKGVRVCVEAAKKKLFAQIKELEDKAVLTVKIPPQYHSVIIGSEGSIIRRLENRYHVRINFPRSSKSGDTSPNGEAPPPRQAPDEIIIRGSKKEAEEARQEIIELWKFEAENSHVATIMVTAGSIGSMFRNFGKEIKQLRESSSVKIAIPRDESLDPDTKVEIKIRGKRDEVSHAKNVLSKIVQSSENTSSRTINVEKRFHRFLIGPGGQILKNIVAGAGGPDDRAGLARTVRFPDQGTASDEITVYGDTAIVDKIIASIEEIVAEKANQTTVILDVAPEKHRKLIGRQGSVRRELEQRFRVAIEIPRQHPNTQTSSEVKITGSQEAVDQAKEHIQELIREVEGETVQVPRHLHHAIGDGGFFKSLYNKYKVSVEHNGQSRPPRPMPEPKYAKDDLPLISDEDSEDKIYWETVEVSSEESSDTFPWVLRGPPEGVTNAKTEITKALEVAKSHSCAGFLILPDPRKYRFVVGPGGSTIEEIRKNTGCRITVPRSQTVGEPITLYGSQEGLEKAKAAILEAVKGSSGNRW